jgi:hypothetical protein
MSHDSESAGMRMNDDGRRGPWRGHPPCMPPRAPRGRSARGGACAWCSVHTHVILEYNLPIIVRVLKYRSARTLVPEGWSTGYMYQLD